MTRHHWAHIRRSLKGSQFRIVQGITLASKSNGTLFNEFRDDRAEIFIPQDHKGWLVEVVAAKRFSITESTRDFNMRTKR